ncbi:Methyltransferase type 11 [Acididesulfobacillus acetoxydans]|uniref:Methylase involved in ubiquinone/menaquinone biosynthesis n=1 Tax=Acididesulfobacillus acetoxydans TaxID=1561005 RepID=A0A8S0WG03_9FIRM|nr:class I SAM-dependent methyltransferase [Acididesulfobacillus acetoxydans]CAA7601482.1 Methyltransferase type 11 [Acididesulfobacillus acetoxydans]CEJ06137.1 Methylase involved in ubiquinone/menaquinone biosynthesis [Acididesulfobacillus acetoxydans]
MKRTFEPAKQELELKNHLHIFNLIAPVYNLFFQGQLTNYCQVLAERREFLEPPASSDLRDTLPPQDLPAGSAPTVLDIGCGTGALAACFAKLGYDATGVDFSQKMLAAAAKSNGNRVKLVQGDATTGLPFRDKSFDLVVSAYVLHGLTARLRRSVMLEARRLARQRVLFYDYNSRRGLFTNLAEWAEGGDYFNFIHTGEEEMRGIFSAVQRHDVGKRAAIYVCSL